MKRTESDMPPGDDAPVMADREEGDFVLVPLEVPVDTIIRETFAPVIRVDHNGTLMEVNEHGRPILAILGCDIGQRAPDFITQQIPGVLISGCAINEIIESRGKRLTLTISTLDDRFMRLLPGPESANRVLVLVDRPGTESPALRMLPMALYTSTRDRWYGDSWISSGIEELTGFSPSRFTSGAGFWMSRIHPVDRPMVMKDLGRLEAAGRTCMEYRFQCADGIYRWIADHIELPPGLTTVFGMMVDIDIRKRNELDSQDRSEFLEMLLDNASHGVVVLDKDARPLYMNPWFAGRFGYRREDWLRGLCRLRFHPDDSKAGQDALSNAEAGIPAQCMVRIGNRDGNWRCIRLLMSPLAWRGKKLALCTASDMPAEGWAKTEQDSHVKTDVHEHIRVALADPATCISGKAVGDGIRGRLRETLKALHGESRSI